MRPLVLVVTPEAKRDILEAARWYELQSSGLGGRFLDEVERAFRRLSEGPLAWPQVHRRVRRILIRRFPFAVFYKVGRQDAVVLAVLHGARDPNAWKART